LCDDSGGLPFSACGGQALRAVGRPPAHQPRDGRFDQLREGRERGTPMTARKPRAVLALFLVLAPALSGCGPYEQAGGRGGGPGHREQRLALTPQQELQLGRQAYQEVLNNPREYGPALPSDNPEVRRVRGIMRRLIKASEIEPLQREINLKVKDYRFEW